MTYSRASPPRGLRGFLMKPGKEFLFTYSIDLNCNASDQISEYKILGLEKGFLFHLGKNVGLR